MTKLYLAGPMSGLPEFNYPAFMAAERQLVEAGYEVENPARNVLAKDRPKTEPMWLAFMRMSLVQISRVDGLAMLPGWLASSGATLEHQIGTGLKLPVARFELWLQKPECPECALGKAGNCAGLAVHPVTDELVECSGVDKVAAP